jgi:hypothetical protein
MMSFLFVIPERAEGANPESRPKRSASFWIPDRRLRGVRNDDERSA